MTEAVQSRKKTNQERAASGKTFSVSASLHLDLLQALDSIAAKPPRRSRSNLIREVLRAYVVGNTQ